ALLIGAAFEDDLAWTLQLAGALLLFLAGAAAAMGDPRVLGHAPPELVQAYPLAVVAIALGYGALVGNRLFYYQAAATFATFLMTAGWRGYLLMRQVIAGLDHIAWG